MNATFQLILAWKKGALLAHKSCFRVKFIVLTKETGIISDGGRHSFD